MLPSKSRGRARALVPTIIFDAAAISLGVPLWAACSGGGGRPQDAGLPYETGVTTNAIADGGSDDASPSTTPSRDQCAVQPDASIIVGRPAEEVFLSLVGPASACPGSDASPFGELPSDLCEKLCPPTEPDGGTTALTGCGVLEVTATGTIDLAADGGTAAPGGYVECCYYPCFTGRRPEGLTLGEPSGDDKVGRYLASVAYLEAASVHAFERLTRELTTHDAPAPLRDASRRAVRDERRHARMMRRLAARYGVAVPPVTSGPRAMRSLEDIAVENAVEGCVRETFGAAAAIIQARRAADPDVRRTMASIARDETRHATLAWGVASWLDTRLGARARASVAARRRDAIKALAREAAIDPFPAVRFRLGVPSAAEGRRLLSALDRMLWS
jgi:rubrerythrin